MSQNSPSFCTWASTRCPSHDTLAITSLYRIQTQSARYSEFSSYNPVPRDPCEQQQDFLSGEIPLCSVLTGKYFLHLAVLRKKALIVKTLRGCHQRVAAARAKFLLLYSLESRVLLLYPHPAVFPLPAQNSGEFYTANTILRTHWIYVIIFPLRKQRMKGAYLADVNTYSIPTSKKGNTRPPRVEERSLKID